MGKGKEMKEKKREERIKREKNRFKPFLP